MRAIVQCLVLVSILWMLNACALAPARAPQGALPQQVDDGVQRLWWAVRFRIYWLPPARPDWAMDHLLAHAVFKPVLDAHVARIPLWRFHRRAAPDRGGHQFSLIFYADKATARQVQAAVEQHPLSQQLLAAGFVERLFLNSHNYPQRERVAATSDPNWSPTMQRQWPAYIMGVSALWLGMVDEFATAQPVPSDLPGKMAVYRQVAQQMRAHWRGEGMHALFHHLSAAFGYEPLPLGEQEVRF